MGSSDNVNALVSKCLRDRITVTYALCAVAESKVRAGELEESVESVKAIRRLIAEITVLVSQPYPISISTIREAGELVAELEHRIQAIETAIGPQAPFAGRRVM